MRLLLSAVTCVAAALTLAESAHAQEAPFVRDVFVRINRHRTQNGLKPCAYNKVLEKAAQRHAEWMARQRKMEHLQEAPQNVEQHRTSNHHPIHRVINAGYVSWDEMFTVEPNATGAVISPKPGANESIGEIIAAAWGGGHPASHSDQMVVGWMKSPGHRKEILTSHYKQMGIGVACTPDGKDTFWCVVFGDPIK